MNGNHGMDEELIIARFPPLLADVIRHRLQNDEPLDDMRLQFHDTSQVNLGPDTMAYGRVANFMIGEHTLHARLIDLPCVIEAMKTRDNSNYVKIGHVGQMLCVTESSVDLPDIGTTEAFVSPHGITPPAFNTVSRFRVSEITEEDKANMERVENELERVIQVCSLLPFHTAGTSLAFTPAVGRDRTARRRGSHTKSFSWRSMRSWSWRNTATLISRSTPTATSPHASNARWRGRVGRRL